MYEPYTKLETALASLLFELSDYLISEKLLVFELIGLLITIAEGNKI